MAYFSSKVYSWVGGLEWISGTQSIDLHFEPGDQNDKNATFTPWAKRGLFHLQSVLLGRCAWKTQDVSVIFQEMP